jgi:hypothetical protein
MLPQKYGGIVTQYIFVYTRSVAEGSANINTKMGMVVLAMVQTNASAQKTNSLFTYQLYVNKSM